MTATRQVPLKHLAAINSRTLPGDTDPDRVIQYIDISAVGRGRLVSEPQSMRFEDAPSRARRLVQPGDTIVSTVRTYLRAVWPVEGDTSDLVVSTGFAVLSPYAIEPRFFSWWVRSNAFIEELVARSVGVSYPAINALDIGQLLVRVPHDSEQRAIANYLDTETARIDALITKKRHLIELLDQRTDATIEQLFPVGEAPLVRLAYLARVQTGVTVSSKRAASDDDISVPYLRVANVQPGRLDLHEVKDIAISPAMASRSWLRDGDVLMTEGGDIDKLGRGTVWRSELPRCVHQNHVFAVRPDHSRLNPDYLAAITRTAHARAYFESTGVQSTNLASTSSTKVADFLIPYQPIDDQERAVAKLREVEGAHLAATRALERQTDLLLEHRQALITAAVTGEFAVPGFEA